MPDFSWLAAEEDLSPAALTLRAQTISPNDDGSLLWDGFMPRVDVDSTKVADITSLDVRVVADRREWNQRGRNIPLETPDTREIEFVPIESNFKLEESEMNKIMNEVRGNQDLFRQIIGARIPTRTDGLALANVRRLEMDTFEAWALGQVTQKNPQTGGTYVLDFGFDAARYQTAGTAWNDVGVNAYEEFKAWLEDAVDYVGPIRGAAMRRATARAIQADAPNPMPGLSDLTPTMSQVEERLSDELSMPFRFYILENSLDVFDDGGTAKTRTKVWAAQRVAVVPDGIRVGNAAFAPVLRAYDISQATPQAGIDLRGQTVYHDIANGGRELAVECQLNAFPVPDEQKLFVIDAGV